VPLLELVPRSFGEYEAAGGGRGLQAALAAWPVAVIQEVALSGLRGRGGAGFPTGKKWRAVRAVGAGPRYAVCNAAEGEPATFKDRLLLRTNPYQVLEGLAIAAYAVGAERAYVGLKEAFTPEIQALTRALEEMRDADALGPVPVEIVGWPTRFVGGDGSARRIFDEPLPAAATVRTVLRGLSARFPELAAALWHDGDLGEHIEVLVNDAVLGIEHTLDSPLRPGDTVGGPAVIEEYGSTLPLHPGFRAEVDRLGNLVVVRDLA